MSCSNYDLRGALIQLLLEQTIRTVSEVPYLLDTRYGVSTTEGSVRVTLAKLVAEGKATNYARGCYCTPGREPPKYDLLQWTAIQVAQAYPGAADAATLKRRFKRAHGYPVPPEELSVTLDKLVAEGKMHTVGKKQPAYQWPRSPTRADLGFTSSPQPAVNPFD